MPQLKSLHASAAAALDAKLMGPSIGYTIDQLMELAGLSCAHVVFKQTPSKKDPIVIVCGPGNNGGDGVVCARHLHLFGFQNLFLYWPIKGSLPFYKNLQSQIDSFGINQITSMDKFKDILQLNNLTVVDSLFGFSFHPPLRSPFDSILTQIVEAQSKNNAKIISIDIPSGWDVDKGPSDTVNYYPNTLISLTAPKPCSKFISKRSHFLGGRFVPDSVAQEFNITEILSLYKAYDQIIDISNFEII